MKPTKLIISAFGPYADTMPAIEFDQFQERGLFLIAGDTGAGKTTIFDAICYALYGTPSGSYRDSRNLRSEYASPDTPSFVDFYFTHQGRSYHVWRQPEYVRPKQRGEGNVLQPARAVLCEEGQQPVEGLRQVNAAIEELLHINEKQFKQIAMIAQGEFWSLLNARTDQRTEILRTIFATGAYNRIEYRLKEQLSKSVREKENTERSVIQYFRDARAPQESPLREDLRHLQADAAQTGGVWNLEGMLDILDALIAEDAASAKVLAEEENKAAKEQKELQDRITLAEMTNRQVRTLLQLREEKAELDGRREAMEASAQRLARQKAAVRSVLPCYRSWETRCRELEAGQQQIADKKEELAVARTGAERAEKRLTEAMSRKPAAEELQKRADVIARERDRYRQRDVLTEELAQAENKRAELDAKGRAAARQEAEHKEEAKRLTEAIARRKSGPLELAKEENRRKELERLLETVSRLANEDIPRTTECRERLLAAQQRFTAAQAQYDAAVQARMRAERALDNCRAGILAGRLKDGEKCPVCGALHHPEPAVLPAEAVTEKEAAAYREKEKRSGDEKNAALVAAERERTRLESLERQLKEALRGCLAHPLLEGCEADDSEDPAKAAALAGTQLRELLTASEARLGMLREDCAELERSEKALESIGEENEKLAAQREKLSQEQSGAMQRITQIRATLETLSDLQEENWAAAEAQMQNLRQQARELLDRIEQCASEKAKTDLLAADAKAALTTMEAARNLQKADEMERRSCLDRAVAEQGFASVEEMLGFATDEKTLETAEEEQSAYRQRVMTNAERLAAAEEETKGVGLIATEEWRQKEQEKAKAAAAVRQRRNETESRLQINRQIRANIERQQETLEKARKESGVCKRLYELVKGTTGNGKITLEQYIQAAGFDGILAAANRRLLPMSDGQFELFRREDAVSRKSGNFLDLEVLDNYTGHRRPVGSLSGGESFKASLSLALGLSDTVSANLGGIQMDALFIDEGFGTLDRKSIDAAMDVLLHLSGSSKLVGIISHREELLESIPQQILVSKTRKGSTLRMVQ